MESRTDPMAPNTIGDDSVDGEIAGENAPLKMHEDGPAPPAGALDTKSPNSRPAPNPEGDPGLTGSSRDPDLAESTEENGWPGPKNGGTPYDAEGASGSEGE